jgi:tRNA (guanine37-N1)-methyltransferase
VLDEAAGRARVLEVSLGDYVLNGGEVAVLAIVEAVARLLPGVIGNAESLLDESHSAVSGGLLEAPGWTKPSSWRGHAVPEVLLSGDHGRIARWRRDQALRRTSERRPDLLAALDPAALDRHDLGLLAGLGWAVGPDGRLARGSAPVAD